MKGEKHLNNVTGEQFSIVCKPALIMKVQPRFKITMQADGSDGAGATVS